MATRNWPRLVAFIASWQTWRSSASNRFLTASFGRRCSALSNCSIVYPPHALEGSVVTVVLCGLVILARWFLYFTHSWDVCDEIPVSTEKLREIVIYLTVVSIHPLRNVEWVYAIHGLRVSCWQRSCQLCRASVLASVLACLASTSPRLS